MGFTRARARVAMVAAGLMGVALVGCSDDGTDNETAEPAAAESEPAGDQTDSETAEPDDETDSETAEPADDGTDSEPAEPRPVATEPVVGACIEDLSVMEVGDHATHTPDAFVYVDCAGVHGAEILGVLEIEGEEYPGVEAIGQQLGDFCADAGKSYIYDRSVTYDGRAYIPTEAQWEDGHRAALCFVLPPTGVEHFEGPVGG